MTCLSGALCFAALAALNFYRLYSCSDWPQTEVRILNGTYRNMTSNTYRCWWVNVRDSRSLLTHAHWRRGDSRAKLLCQLCWLRDARSPSAVGVSPSRRDGDDDALWAVSQVFTCTVKREEQQSEVKRGFIDKGVLIVWTLWFIQFSGSTELHNWLLVQLQKKNRPIQGCLLPRAFVAPGVSGTNESKGHYAHSWENVGCSSTWQKKVISLRM